MESMFLKNDISSYYKFVVKVITTTSKWIYVVRKCTSIRLKLSKSILIVLLLQQDAFLNFYFPEWLRSRIIYFGVIICFYLSNYGASWSYKLAIIYWKKISYLSKVQQTLKLHSWRNILFIRSPVSTDILWIYHRGNTKAEVWTHILRWLLQISNTVKFR